MLVCVLSLVPFFCKSCDCHGQTSIIREQGFYFDDCGENHSQVTRDAPMHRPMFGSLTAIGHLQKKMIFTVADVYVDLNVA